MKNFLDKKSPQVSRPESVDLDIILFRISGQGLVRVFDDLSFTLFCNPE